MKTTLIITIAALIVALGGCGHNQEDSVNKIDKVAAQARTDIDALAAMVGTDPEIRQNDITDCVPGREDSGKDLIYSVHVKVTPGTLARLKGEIADDLAAQGWAVHPGPAAEEVSFTKGRTTMGATVWEDLKLADIGGSGGCVK